YDHMTPPSLPGKELVDVGCGTGTLAARASAMGARVTAVDPDPGMLEFTRKAASGATLLAGSVPDLPFAAGTFEAVAANFVVNHVGDPRAAAADLTRVCAPGGAVGVTIWPSGPSALNSLWADVVRASGAVTPPPSHLPVEKDFERTAEGLARLLTEAHLSEVRATTLKWDFRIAPDELWAGPAGGVAGIGKIVVSQTPSMQASMKQHYDRITARMIRNGEVVLHAEAVMAVGRKYS
ncbi:class I SAM-dependent methyltransferase, partial [Arthrobacter sp. ISL-30]|uniref:class I SAM-dependent methyltransferase n=1 Tax=Arthrobacter sp. ISL-30 TaxID=2819109 RepID=UPI001BEC5E18